MSVDPLHSTIEEFAVEGYKHIECCPRWRVIQLRVMSSLPCVLIVSFLPVLGGCATSSSSTFQKSRWGSHWLSYQQGFDALSAAARFSRSSRAARLTSWARLRGRTA